MQTSRMGERSFFVLGGLLCLQQMLVGSVVTFELQDRCGKGGGG